VTQHIALRRRFIQSTNSFRYLACQVVAVCGRRSRCSCTSRSTVCQQPAVARFLSQPPFSWNTLPDDVQSASSVSSFRRQLKIFLFHQSFPDINCSLNVRTTFSWTLQQFRLKFSIETDVEAIRVVQNRNQRNRLKLKLKPMR